MEMGNIFCSLEWMVDTEILEVESIRENICLLVAKRDKQCKRLLREMAAAPDTEGYNHLSRTRKMLKRDHSTLLGMKRSMDKVLIELERLRISIRTIDELESFRNILYQTRHNLSGLSRTQGEVEILVEEMEESTTCLNAVPIEDGDDDDDEERASAETRFIVENLPLVPRSDVAPPKLYSSINGGGGG